MTEHRYRPVGSALELFRCREPEVLLSGAAGTGKSRACADRVVTPGRVHHRAADAAIPADPRDLNDHQPSVPHPGQACHLRVGR